MGKLFLTALSGKQLSPGADFERTKCGDWRTISALRRRAREWERLKMKKDTREKLVPADAKKTEPANGTAGNREAEIPGRRKFLQASLLGGAVAASGPVLQPMFGAARENAAAAEPAPVATFELDEITIGELQEGMKSGKYSARSIVEKYLARIAAIDKS